MTEHRPPRAFFPSILDEKTWAAEHSPRMPSSPPNPHREPGRRQPVHWPMHEKDGSPIIIFLTVCAFRRKKIFDRVEAVETILEAWRKADAWAVGRYVVMPDHIHLFCSPQREGFSLMSWVRFWKSHVSRHWKWPAEQPIWQVDFWDTQLRRGGSYASKWAYVCENPVRHGLVERAEDWPWAGEVEILDWREP